MKKILITLTIIIAIIALLGSLVVVKEDQYACIKRFSQVVDIKQNAGLKFKLPFVDSVQIFQKNKQIYDLSPSDVLTADKKAMIVDNYVVWKISDPLLFIKTVSYVSEMEKRIDATVYNAVKNKFGTLEQTEIINERMVTESSDDEIVSFNEQITESVKNQLKDYGIEIVDVNIKRLDLPMDNENAVFNRMISERSQIAAGFKAEGGFEASKIINETDKNVGIILSQAKATGEQLKAEGEAEYMRILAEAYSGSERSEFYEFIRKLDALKKSMKGEKTIILPIGSPLTEILLGR